MIRLFIAIDLPPTIRHMLYSMGRGIPNARPVKEEQIHLTLRFIGDVEGSRLKDIHESLTSVAIHPFSISVKGVGHFPPRGKPRVIWAGVQPAEQLIQMRNRIGTQLANCGIEPERRKFMPHITLARLQNTPAKRLGEFLAGNSFFETEKFPVECFNLYSSKLTQKGAIHTVERSYFLETPDDRTR